MLFNPMDPNGFTMYVMQSAEYTDTILEKAESCVTQKHTSASGAVKMAMLTNHISESDLTESDIDKINTWIKENS